MEQLEERSAVIVGYQPLWLEALELLMQKAGVPNVRVTTTPAAALKLVQEHEPDVFLSDIDGYVDPPSGLECIRRVKEIHPNVKTIVVATAADEASVDAAFAAGADAYCTKTAEPTDLAVAIRQSFEHSIYLASGRGRRETVHEAPPQFAEAGLTPREREILRLVAEGHSNAVLARMLWVTEQTVKFHLSNIYRKLGVSNRTEASRWAQVKGLLTAVPATHRNESAAA
jgi:DNA-binding NarL/FixJ family response regulator